MAVKDYYKMLEVHPGATQAEIKRAYRKLALRYHPDTNQGSPYSEAWFRELQEAYKTLTRPDLRDAYHQERWLQQSMGRPLAKAAPLTPDFIWEEARKIGLQVEQLDHFRMDHEALQQNLLQLLSAEKIAALKHYNQQDANRGIIRQVIAASIPLKFSLQPPVFASLRQLSTGDKVYTELINSTEAGRRRHYWWEKNQWWILLLITFLLCGTLFLLA